MERVRGREKTKFGGVKTLALSFHILMFDIMGPQLRRNGSTLQNGTILRRQTAVTYPKII